MRHEEIERARRKRPESMDSYDLYLRALPETYRPTPAGSAEALRLLEKGYAIDPNYAPAHVIGAWLYFYRVAATWSESPQADRARVEKLARAAIDQGEGDPYVLALGGFLLAATGGDVEVGVSAADRAVELAPHSAIVWQHAGWALTFTGDQDRAIDYLKTAIRLSPSDPLSGTYRGSRCISFGRPLYGRCAIWRTSAAPLWRMGSYIPFPSRGIRSARSDRKCSRRVGKSSEA